MSAAFRPTFSLELDCPSKVVLERIFAQIGEGRFEVRRARELGTGKTGSVEDRDEFVVTMLEADQRVWSPWLNVDVKPHGNGTTVFARFSPSPSVWTGFAAAYLVLTTLSFFSLCVTWALVTSGSSPWTLAVTAGAGVAMIALWGVSQIGQRLAHDQMLALRAELDTALNACVAQPAPVVVTPNVASLQPG